MPAPNREADVLAALRELGSGTKEDVASRAGMSSKAVLRHLKNLELADLAFSRKEQAPPFKKVWTAV